MSSQSWYSCGFFCLLWLVDVPVLSNFVCAGSFHPKPTKDYKVSVCIKIMRMRNSCLCTYCLQEGLMSMKVFSLIIFCSDAYGQDTCNTLLTLSCLRIHMLLYSIFTWLRTCRGAYACYMSFQSFTCYSLYLYLKLWCMLSTIWFFLTKNLVQSWKHKCPLGGFGI